MSASTEAVQTNEDKILDFAREAIKNNAKIICFPEMSMIGYSFMNLDIRLEAQTCIIHKLEALAQKHRVTILIGGIEAVDHKIYICQYVINNVIRTYRKIHIGQKESAYVSAGDEIKVFEQSGIKFGIMLCYDGHFPELSSIMARQGAKILFNPSASPNEPPKRLEMWAKYLVARAYDNRVWVVANNLCFNNKGGGMMVIDSNGNTVDRCGEYGDYMLVVDYSEVLYSETSMKRRDFKVDRRQDIYNQYLELDT